MSFQNLSWGVKASFCSYVETMGGSIEASDGATRTEDGSFVFPAAPGGTLSIAPDGSATGSIRFTGTVTFDAHGGMLKVTLNELGIDVDTEGLILTAPQAPLNKERCAIARLKIAGEHASNGLTLAAEITLDGMYQIADNYPPGTEMDPVQLG